MKRFIRDLRDLAAITAFFGTLAYLTMHNELLAVALVAALIIVAAEQERRQKARMRKSAAIAKVVQALCEHCGFAIDAPNAIECTSAAHPQLRRRVRR
jgi:hypothetical protein